MRMIVTLGPLVLAAASAAAAGPHILVRVTNPLDAPRPMETVEVAAAALAPGVPAADLPRLVVTDGRSGREVLSQAVDEDGDGAFDRLVFQSDFAPGETREFTLVRGEARKPRLADYRVYGRFVRERHDDFAWENDRVAFRIYGQALETFEKEPLTSSTVDAWSKRTRRLVLNDWYLVDDYHRDHGEGGDFYSAGRTRGCGGSGLMVDGALAVSKNFRSSRVLASGPLRLVFEVSYPEWEKPGLKVTEVKRVTLDAGSHFNRFESFYTVGGADPITWAAGIRKAKDVVPRVDRERGDRADVGAPDELRRRRLARLRRRDGPGARSSRRGRAGRQPARRGADAERSARHLVRGLRLGPERRTSRTWPRGTGTSTPSPRACARL